MEMPVFENPFDLGKLKELIFQETMNYSLKNRLYKLHEHGFQSMENLRLTFTKL